MFERFTERARQVVILSQEEARNLKHNYIGTEHILLGLIREEEGIACRVLESYEVTLDYVRAAVTRIVGSGVEVTSGQIPFTPRAKKIMDLSLREALSLGHNYIGTEHILLGLVREGEGVGYRILQDVQVDAEKIRNEVIRMLSGPGSRRMPVRPPEDWTQEVSDALITAAGVGPPELKPEPVERERELYDQAKEAILQRIIKLLPADGDSAQPCIGAIQLADAYRLLNEAVRPKASW